MSTKMGWLEEIERKIMTKSRKRPWKRMLSLNNILSPPPKKKDADSL